MCKGCDEFLVNLQELPRIDGSDPVVFQAPGGFPSFRLTPFEADQLRESRRVANERLSRFESPK